MKKVNNFTKGILFSFKKFRSMAGSAHHSNG